MVAASLGTCRIALIGDSHTFGLELKFEDTWGSLEGYLPKGCKILNFGVKDIALVRCICGFCETFVRGILLSLFLPFRVTPLQGQWGCMA